LKAKVVQAKEDHEDVEEENEMTSTNDIHVDTAFFTKKWNKNFGKKVLSYRSENRTCYNCDEAKHFADKVSL
jgi:hypothetical protein